MVKVAAIHIFYYEWIYVNLQGVQSTGFFGSLTADKVSD